MRIFRQGRFEARGGNAGGNRDEQRAIRTAAECGVGRNGFQHVHHDLRFDRQNYDIGLPRLDERSIGHTRDAVFGGKERTALLARLDHDNISRFDAGSRNIGGCEPPLQDGLAHLPAADDGD